MNELESEAAPEESAPSCKDRSGGLILFGILTILLGCVCGLFIPLMLAGGSAAAAGGSPQSPVPAILPAVSVYGMLAVALVWLGIGSCMARRWARALLLIFSWSWLMIGLVTVPAMAYFMPKALAIVPATAPNGQPALPPGMMGAVIAGMVAIFGIIFIALPAIWTFFYSSRHVKATCERRDPVVRWTDTCPLPVLGLALWMTIGVPTMLIMPFTGHCVMPFFGTFITGAPADLWCLGAAAIWGYAAWSLYKLERLGWWLILIGMLVYFASTLLTFARNDPTVMYRLMNYPEAEITQINKIGFTQIRGMMEWMMSIFMLPFLGYLLFIRKYLRRPA